MIYHLLGAGEWEAARAGGAVRPPSLEAEGFVHCSTAEQVRGVVARFYTMREDLVVLEVDPHRLGAELRWEPPAHEHPDAGERFPHLYGPLPVDAVRAVTPYARWTPP